MMEAAAAATPVPDGGDDGVVVDDAEVDQHSSLSAQSSDWSKSSKTWRVKLLLLPPPMTEHSCSLVAVVDADIRLMIPDEDNIHATCATNATGRFLDSGSSSLSCPLLSISTPFLQMM
jgi:hypothetical protein